MNQAQTVISQTIRDFLDTREIDLTRTEFTELVSYVEGAFDRLLVTQDVFVAEDEDLPLRSEYSKGYEAGSDLAKQSPAEIYNVGYHDGFTGTEIDADDDWLEGFSDALEDASNA